MKKLLILGLTVTALLLWPLFRADSGRRTEPQSDVGETTENVGAREAFRLSQLQDENGVIPPNGWAKARKAKNEMPLLQGAWSEFWDAPAQGPLPWVSIGPGNVGGRVRSILVHPTKPNVIWAGGVTGGIWTSTNGGGSWSTNTDYSGNINISHMVMDSRDSSVIYAATGGETLTGNGIFKTRNLGKDWEGLRATQDNANFAGVNRLAISGAGVLLAGTYQGLFRSVDGGTTWNHTTGTTGDIYDVQFHPTEPQKCMASGRSGNIYYSTNGGNSWSKSVYPIRPPGSGTIKVAYARSNPSIVYANTLTESQSGQLYISLDGGRSFIPTGQCCTGVLWWANCLWVDPTNENTVIFGGGTIYRSFDRGATKVHAQGHHEDAQIIVEAPGYDGITNRTAYLGTDGGLDKTDDILNVPNPEPQLGNSWIDWQNINNGIGITQFLGAAGNPTSGVIIGGTQDNANIRYNPESGLTWHGLNWGDGGYCAADQTDPMFFYMESYYLTLLRSRDGGKSVEWIYANLPRNCNGLPCANFTAPFILDPNHQDWMLAGGVALWKSANIKVRAEEIAWTEIKPQIASGSFISAIGVMRGNSDIIWVGHLDGSVYFTTNGTPANPMWTKVEGLPQRYCSSVTASANGDVFATFGGFTSGNVWRHRQGAWSDVSDGLPELPVYTLVVSPRTPDIVYIGTELGVFASGNGGLTWSPGNRGPADVAVFTLFWMGDDQLVAATFGRGMFTIGPATH